MPCVIKVVTGRSARCPLTNPYTNLRLSGCANVAKAQKKQLKKEMFMMLLDLDLEINEMGIRWMEHFTYATDNTIDLRQEAALVQVTSTQCSDPGPLSFLQAH